MLDESDCLICADLRRDCERSGIALLYGSEALARAILWEDSEFALLAGPGPIRPGYLILSPKYHAPYFGGLTGALLGRGGRIMGSLLAIAEPLAGMRYLVFEHGGSRHRTRGPGCLEHAHLHFAPTPNLNAIISAARGAFNETKLKAFSDLANLPIPYLAMFTAGSAIALSAEGAPSQYIRRLLAAEANVPQSWNWVTHRQTDTFEQTITMFKHLKNAQL